MESIKNAVVKLDRKGNVEVSDLGATSFTGEDGLARALDTARYLGGDHVVTTQTHPGYLVIRNGDHQYGLIITANAGTDTQHYIAYLYIDAGGYGDTYCASKSYGTFKGACKKINQYLSR